LLAPPASVVPPETCRSERSHRQLTVVKPGSGQKLPSMTGCLGHP